MSKLLLGGILAVLVILLWVMSWAVSPHAPEPAAPPKKNEAALKAEREMRIAEETKILKKEAQSSPQGEPKPVPIGKPKLSLDSPEVKKSQNSGPKGMVISNQWTRQRKPGEEGLKELEAKAKESEQKPPVSMAPIQVK